MSAEQAARLTDAGVVIEGPAGGATTSAEGDGVFRPYGGDGGLADELEELADDNPALTELVTIGRSVQGTDIVALKVTPRARTLRDGARPASLFVAGQHAREWISPEMVRPLAHHLVDGYGRDAAITDLLRTTEVWLVPVANPDGYDFTFTPGNRLWRKNLRDNDRDGRITAIDGVDLNRNMPTRWFYDDEGSGSAPAAEKLPGSRAGVGPGDPGARPPDGPDRLRVPAQLPLESPRLSMKLSYKHAAVVPPRDRRGRARRHRPADDAA